MHLLSTYCPDWKVKLLHCLEEWPVIDGFNELLLDLDGLTLPLEWSSWCFECKAQHIETSLLPEPSSTGSFGKNIEYSASWIF